MVTLLAQTVPAVPVEAFASALLDFIAQAVTLVLPFAAAITAFVIGVGMIRRWIGHRPATSLGSSPSSSAHTMSSDEYRRRYFTADDDWGDPVRRARRDSPGFMNRTHRKRTGRW